MMIKKLIREVNETAISSGFDWPNIFTEAEEVVLFGSRSCGKNTDFSDYDVLVVTNHPLRRRTKKGNLDLISIRVEDLDRSWWLESELASHIAQYGIWLKGTGFWRSSAVIGDSAIINKTKLITDRCNALVANHHLLAKPPLEKHLKKIKRDCVRLYLLQQAIPMMCNKDVDSYIKQECKEKFIEKQLLKSNIKVQDTETIMTLLNKHLTW